MSIKFNGIADATTLTDGHITSGSYSLRSLSAPFYPEDVGKTVYVHSGLGGGEALSTTISSFKDSSEVLLAASAKVNSQNAEFTYGTDNLEAIQSSVADAISQKCALIIPAGDYLLNYSTGSARFVDVTGALIIQGEGKDICRLICGPETPSHHFYAFLVRGNAVLDISNLTIQGPLSAGPNGRQNAATVGIRVEGGPCVEGDPCVKNMVRAENVDIRGGFYNAFAMSSDNLDGQGDDATTYSTIELRRCNFGAYFQACAWFCATGATKRVHAFDSVFHTRESTLGRESGHLLYIHPAINLHLENCRFESNERFAVHIYSGGGSSGVNSEYCRIINCTFTNSCHNCILTNPHITTQVHGCSILAPSGNGIIVAGPVEINRTRLDRAPILTFGNGGAHTINVSQCELTGAGLVTNWSGSVWSISDCSFTGVEGLATTFITHSSDSDLTIERCVFRGSEQTVYAIHAYKRAEVRRCIFTGHYNIPVVYMGDDVDLIVDGCIFNHSGGNGATQGWSPSGTVRHSANQYMTNSPYCYVKEEQWQNGTLRSGMCPQVLPSAIKLSISPDYDTVHVSGTETINEILVNGSEIYDRAFAGAHLTLIADGAFIISDTHNIAPKVTRRRNIGEIITLRKDGLSNVWRE